MLTVLAGRWHIRAHTCYNKKPQQFRKPGQHKVVGIC